VVKVSLVLAITLGAIALLLNTLFVTEIMASPAGFVFLGTSIVPIYILSAFFSINSTLKLMKTKHCVLAGINTMYWITILWLNRLLSIFYTAFILWAFYSIITVVLAGN